jgi:hypothetical protein
VGPVGVHVCLPKRVKKQPDETLANPRTRLRLFLLPPRAAAAPLALLNLNLVAASVLLLLPASILLILPAWRRPSVGLGEAQRKAARG